MSAAIPPIATGGRAVNAAVAELSAIPRWVCWKAELRNGRLRKPPYCVGGRRPAKSTDPSTWDTFDACWTSAFADGAAVGIGIVVDGSDGLMGGDLDHCISEDGTISPQAQAIVAKLASYTEVSPSGTGLRVFFRGTMAEKGRKVAHVEIYRTKRYLTVTGDHLAGTPETINPVEPAIIAALLGPATRPNSQERGQVAGHGGARNFKVPTGNLETPTYDDLDIGDHVADELRDRLEDAMASDARVRAAWDGAPPDRNDQSRSAYDLKLAGALRRHGGFSLQDFATLARFWPHGKGADGDPRHWRRTWEAAEPGNSQAKPVTPLVGVPLEDLIRMSLPARPRLLGPWLTKSSLVMVHARTGVGKTWFSLSAFKALAMGSTFLKWTADRPVRVLYLDGEMPGTQMQERGRLLLNGGTTNGNLIVVTPDLQADPMPNLATEQGRARLEPLLAGCDGLAVDHVSALIRCHGEGGEGELWLDQVQPWLLEKRRAGLAILLDHHSGKGGTQRGTSVREDILDVIIKLEQVGEERDGARFNVVFEKTRGFYGKEAETFEAHLSTDANGHTTWTVAEGNNDEFMTFVEMLRDKATVERAAKDLKINRATGFRWKARAIDKGLLL